MQRRKVNLREKGCFYERKAGEYLEKKGYEILEYNFRCRFGEIDLIAKQGNTLVFCEVKYRKGTNTSLPLEAVDHRKQQRISRTALYYLGKQETLEIDSRFDVIGIVGEAIFHIENAFEYTER